MLPEETRGLKKLDFNLDLEFFDPLGIDSLREILITSST